MCRNLCHRFESEYLFTNVLAEYLNKLDHVQHLKSYFAFRQNVIFLILLDLRLILLFFLLPTVDSLMTCGLSHMYFQFNLLLL